MAWWAWILIGVFLLCSELVASTGFTLVLMGAAALLIGAANLMGLEGVLWVEWLAFGVLSSVFVLVFRQRIYGLILGRSEEVPDSPLIGATGKTHEFMVPGGQSRVELRGSSWTILNTGDVNLPEGARFRVVKVDGVMLHVEHD